jgi:LacI family transcriptional regulator
MAKQTQMPRQRWQQQSRAMTVTLKMIADTAGVSIRSVTRALKGETGGNPDTCRKIRELAKELGYVPNAAARNLRMRTSNVVGMISSQDTAQVISRRKMLIQRHLEREGYFPISALLPSSPALLRKILLSWTGLTESIIFSSWPRDWEPDEVLDGLLMNYIFIDNQESRRADKYKLINIDRESGIATAVGHLIDSGRKRIAYCGSDMSTRVNGFFRAFRERGLEPEADAIIDSGHLDLEHGYAAAPALIAGKFDAVFAGTDRLALGIYKYCNDKGVKIPETLAVTGFDNDDTSAYVSPPLSSIAHPEEKISRKVAELIKNVKLPPGESIFPTEFIKRESC